MAIVVYGISLYKYYTNFRHYYFKVEKIPLETVLVFKYNSVALIGLL